jgi:hypothetical protein
VFDRCEWTWPIKSPQLHFCGAENGLNLLLNRRPFLEPGYNQRGENTMVENNDSKRAAADADLEREVREGRKFSLEEAIARMVGPGGMKGVSPVARMQQAEAEIGNWLRGHLIDGGGALGMVLRRQLKGSELLLNNFEQPLAVLSDYCQHVLNSDYQLKELVRDCDIEWGRMMGERPYFDKPEESNPDDPYTVESVRNVLRELATQLAATS